MTSHNTDNSDTSLFFTTNDGIRVAYDIKGDSSSPPLVLIHGWSGSMQSFVRNFEPLSHHFRVIRYDLRAHGSSKSTIENTISTHGMRLSRLAFDLHELLNHLNMESDVSLLGCSLGCAVIWNYIELFTSSRLKACIFVDQSPCQLHLPDGSWSLGSNGLFSDSALAFFSALLLENPEKLHQGTVHACMTRTPTETEVQFFKAEAMKANPQDLVNLMHDHNKNDWRSTLPFVNIPALVVVASKSKIFPPEGVAYAAKVMPRAELVEFEDKGSHWVYYEEAERFNEEVVKFLRAV